MSCYFTQQIAFNINQNNVKLLLLADKCQVKPKNWLCYTVFHSVNSQPCAIVMPIVKALCLAMIYYVAATVSQTVFLITTHWAWPSTLLRQYSEFRNVFMAKQSCWHRQRFPTLQTWDCDPYPQGLWLCKGTYHVILLSKQQSMKWTNREF